MKKTIALSMIILMLVVSFSAFCESAEPFSFRNGVSFGMTETELKQIESANEQISEDSWVTSELTNWEILGSQDRVKVSSFNAYLMYFLYAGQMQAVCYDFRSGNTDETFETITNALSTVYGESSLADSADLVLLMDCFSPGFYNESDLSGGLVWLKDNVTIYQFYYDDNSRFVVFYTNPFWIYSITPSDESVEEVDTTGL